MSDSFLRILFLHWLSLSVCLCLRVYTPDDKTYAFPLERFGFTIENVTSLIFKVKACENAHIITQKERTANFGTPGNYAFIIGSYDNRRVQIAKALNSERYNTRTASVLSCSEFRPFWISWKDGKLKIGKGNTVNSQVLVSHALTSSPDLKYAFLLTGWGHSGCWQIDTGSTVLGTMWQKLAGDKQIRTTNANIYRTENRIECGSLCMSSTDALPCGCHIYSHNQKTKECILADAGIAAVYLTRNDWKTWTLK